MSADPTANLQLFSPPTSGRSSPAPRASRNAAEDCTSRALDNVPHLLMHCSSAPQERQRLPEICRRRRARAGPVGHRPAGMGRLHIVPGKVAEG
jgi:hypothetical protein